MSSGNVDFTSTGFGTPTGAFLIVGGTATENAACYGFYDGTNQRAASFNHDSRRWSATRIYTMVSGDNATGSFITDGLRLNFASAPTDRPLQVILFKGAQVDVGTVTMSGSSTVTTGFSTGLVLMSSLSLTGNYDTDQGLGLLSFGAGTSTSQFAISRRNEATVGYSTIKTGNIYQHQGTGSVSFDGQISTFTSTTFDVDNGVATGFYMAIEATASIDVQTITMPTSVTTDSYNVGFEADAVISLLSAGTVSGATISGDLSTIGGVGLNNNSLSYSRDLSPADAETFVTSKFLDARLTDGVGGWDDYSIATVAGTATGYDITYTAAPPSALLSGVISIEKLSAGVSVEVGTSALTLSGQGASVSTPVGIDVSASPMNLTSQTATVVTPTTISAITSTLSLTGQGVTLLASGGVEIPAVSLNLVGQSVGLSNPLGLTIPVAELTLSGYTAAIITPVNTIIPVSLLNLSGQAVTVQLPTDVVVMPDVNALTLSGLSVVVIGDPIPIPPDSRLILIGSSDRQINVGSYDNTITIVSYDNVITIS